MAENSGAGAAFVTGGAAAGAATSAAFRGMGLAGGFGAVGIGTAPVVGAGAVVGAAAYGAVKAIGDCDATALGTVAFGATAGASVSTVVGGMGLVAPKIGIGVAVGMAPMAAAGAIAGIAVYGIAKILDEAGTGETSAQAFDRMEEKVLQMEAYSSALMELEAFLSGEDLKQKFAAIETEDELEALKAQLQRKTDLKFNSAPTSSSTPTLTPSVTLGNSARQVPPRESQFTTPDIKAEVVSLKAQVPQTWKCIQTIKGHSSSVNSIALSADGQIFASGSDDRTVSLWNLRTGKQIFTFFGCSKGVFSVTLSPDGQMIVSGDLDRTITSWKLDTKAMRSFYSESGSPTVIQDLFTPVAFSPDGQTLASGSADKTIKIWNIRRWASTRTLIGHSDTVWSVAISPDSQTLASGSADKTIMLWRLSSWEQPRILTGHSGWVSSIAFSPDGKTLASGSGDATIKLWNLQTGELIRTIDGHSAAVLSVALSSDGQTLASSSNGTIKIWNLRTGELLSTLSGNSPVAFSPDGQTLVSDGDKSTIKIWRQMQGCDESTLNPVLSGEWWEVLGVNKDAHLDDVKRAYRQLARQYHPDVNRSASAEATIQAINKAYKEFRQKFSKASL